MHKAYKKQTRNGNYWQQAQANDIIMSNCKNGGKKWSIQSD